ncbi:hypothetical protein BGK55_10155 [Xanthomonas citri pv. malvacearum]|nr:hypothetical protein BGK55_10155 [Xanthomonas citri pv. malvacearum]
MRQQQARQQIVSKVIHGEREAITLGASLIGGRAMQACIEDKDVDTFIPKLPYHGTGKVADAGQRGEIKRQDINAFRHAAIFSTSADDDPCVRGSGQILQRKLAKATCGSGHHDDVLRVHRSHLVSP